MMIHIARLMLIGALAGLLPTVAFAATETPVVPTALQVPGDQILLFRVAAQGTQDYECQRTDAGATVWTFRQPRATLTTDDGEQLGIHGRGPFWAAYDGSRTTGSSPVSAPAGDPATDIPLLLLRATSAEAVGRFADVTYVQRLDTQGGVAPSATCDPEQHQTAAVPYTATYYFYGPGEAR